MTSLIAVGFAIIFIVLGIVLGAILGVWIGFGLGKEFEARKWRPAGEWERKNATNYEPKGDQ